MTVSQPRERPSLSDHGSVDSPRDQSMFGKGLTGLDVIDENCVCTKTSDIVSECRRRLCSTAYPEREITCRPQVDHLTLSRPMKTRVGQGVAFIGREMNRHPTKKMWVMITTRRSVDLRASGRQSLFRKRFAVSSIMN